MIARSVQHLDTTVNATQNPLNPTGRFRWITIGVVMAALAPIISSFSLIFGGCCANVRPESDKIAHTDVFRSTV